MGRVFIIAEAGVNHNGSLRTAKRLVDVACAAGADAVKFQTFEPEEFVSENSPKAEYQKSTTAAKESHLDMIKRLRLSADAHMDLARYCRKKGIIFLSSPFDIKSIELLKDIGLEIFKIPSGEITNLPFLRKVGRLRKKVILSTGMSTMKEIENALGVLVEAGTAKKEITVLHCNTAYPTPFEDVNLHAMLAIKEAFNVAVGYSDHTLGIEVPIAAVALGATVIEKHFTLDRSMKGPDHKASLEPRELHDMVIAVRNIEKAIGKGIKKPSPSELENRYVARKSIVARMKIRKGELFTEGNITTKRPGMDMTPMSWDEVMSKRAKRNFEKDEPIEV